MYYFNSIAVCPGVKSFKNIYKKNKIHVIIEIMNA